MENRVNSPKKKNILDRIANQLENITADINNKTDLTELKKKLKALVLKYTKIKNHKINYQLFQLIVTVIKIKKVISQIL